MTAKVSLNSNIFVPSGPKQTPLQTTSTPFIPMKKTQPTSYPQATPIFVPQQSFVPLPAQNSSKIGF